MDEWVMNQVDKVFMENPTLYHFEKLQKKIQDCKKYLVRPVKNIEKEKHENGKRKESV